MSIKTRCVQIGSCVLLAGLFGCSTLADLGIAVPYLGDPPVTSIAQLHDKPKGALIYLRGIVGDRAPFLTGGAYLLKDPSGTIWIRTPNHQLPKQGREIVVKGQIEFQSVPQGVQESREVYVQELEQMDAVAVNPSPVPSPTLSPPVKPSASVPPVNPPQASAPPPVAPSASVPPVNPPPVSAPPPVAPAPKPPQPVAEITPPQPPASAKPIEDPLDTLFLPHKQGRK